MEKDVLKELLDAFYDRYDTADFIENDPVSVPHLFTGREDREIAGFLAATVAWGNRRAIVRSGRRMMELMDGAPYEFTLHASPEELRPLGHFVHRTFNGTDFIAFVLALRRLCTVWGGIGQFFEERYAATGDLRIVLAEFRREFFACDHPVRCEKHVSSIERKASCKRLNMYLRWMVRDDAAAWISGCGNAYLLRLFICRSMSTAERWRVLSGCCSGDRTTGGLSKR